MLLLYADPRAPTIGVQCWEDVESIDTDTLALCSNQQPLTLCNIAIRCTGWKQHTRQHILPVTCGPNVPFAARLLFGCKSCTSQCSMATLISKFIMPSQKLPKRLVGKLGRATDEAVIAIHNGLGKQIARFKAVCLVEDGVSVWEPTMEDITTLSESFHLCVAYQVGGRQRWDILPYDCHVHILQKNHIASMLFF